jgi:hypothetical protein
MKRGILVLEKCTRQFALNVERNVKFRSSHRKEDLFIAEIVIRRKRSSNRIA